MLTDLRTALSFLTVLPMGDPANSQPGRAFAWFPLTGLLIGVFLALLSALLPPSLMPWGVLFAWVVITGGLHLDGLGDSCDGLLATTMSERRLEIMKDPRTGTWAVVGLIVLLLGKFALIGQIAPLALIIVPTVGRWAMVCAAVWFPYVGGGGLGAYFRQGLGTRQLLIASFSAVVMIAGLARLYPTALIGLGAPMVAFVTGKWASQRLGGGLTGDVYGAICEVTELLCLIGMVWANG